MAAPAILTKKGQVTSYGLSCGYTETAGTENDRIILDSFNSGGQVYRLSWWEGNYRREETYRSIVTARKAFAIVASMKKRVRSYDKV